MGDLGGEVVGSDGLLVVFQDVVCGVTATDALAGKHDGVELPVKDAVCCDAKETAHLAAGPQVDGEGNSSS